MYYSNQICTVSETSEVQSRPSSTERSEPQVTSETKKSSTPQCRNEYNDSHALPSVFLPLDVRRHSFTLSEGCKNVFPNKIKNSINNHDSFLSCDIDQERVFLFFRQQIKLLNRDKYLELHGVNIPYSFPFLTILTQNLTKVLEAHDRINHPIEDLF